MKNITPIYLYAIVDAQQSSLLDSCLSGIEEQLVYTIKYNNVAAIVSNISHQTIRPERRFLNIHHKLLQYFIQQFTVLPVKFGMIAKSSAAITKLLTKNYAVLNEQLRHYEGMIEMNITMRWDVANIYEYLVKNHSELKVAREILLKNTNTSRTDQIEIGELFESVLDREREKHTKKLLSMIKSTCEDIMQNDLRSTEDILNLVCLIRSNNKGLFENKITELAANWNDDYLIKYTGPWPLQNFVQLDLEV